MRRGLGYWFLVPMFAISHHDSSSPGEGVWHLINRVVIIL